MRELLCVIWKRANGNGNARMCGFANTSENGNAEIVGAYGIRPVRHRTNPANIPPQHRQRRCQTLAEASQFRAYAIRPYSGGLHNNATATTDMRDKAARNGGGVHNDAAAVTDVRELLCGMRKRTNGIGKARIVGAYGIRPPCRRMRPANIPPQHRRKRCKTAAEASQFRAYAIRPYGGAIRNYAAAMMDVRDKAIPNGSGARNYAAAVMDMRDKAAHHGGAIHNHAATIMDGQASGGVHICTAAV